MQEIDRGPGQEHGSFWEENRNLAAGVVLASAVAAGVVAYMLRRSHDDTDASELASEGWERARDLGSVERLDAARELLLARLVPELRPTLLAAVRDLREVVDEYFQRVEKSLKHL